MSCTLQERMVDVLDGKSASGPELRAHAGGCAECGPELARLEETWASLAREEAAQPEALARVRAAVEREADGRAWLQLGIVVVAGLVAFAGALAAFGVRPRPEDWGFLPVAQRYVSPVILIALYLAGMGVFFLARRLWGAFLVAAAAAAVAVGATEPGYQFEPIFIGTGCLQSGIIVGLAPLGVALLLARGRVDGRALAGATAGAAAGLIAMAALHLHCPAGNAPHGLVTHTGVTLVLAAGGEWLGRKILRGATLPRPAR